jgi:hypothetical protein
VKEKIKNSIRRAIEWLKKNRRRKAVEALYMTLPKEGVKANKDLFLSHFQTAGAKPMKDTAFRLYADWLRLKQILGEDYTKLP